jgi:hypothetical protein
LQNLGFISISFIQGLAFITPLQPREFYLLFIPFKILRHISVLGLLERVEWKVCMQNQENLRLPLADKFSYVVNAAKSNTLKKYFSFGAVHHPFLRRRFALNSEASYPAGTRYKEPLYALHIPTHPPRRSGSSFSEGRKLEQRSGTFFFSCHRYNKG